MMSSSHSPAERWIGATPVAYRNPRPAFLPTAPGEGPALRPRPLHPPSPWTRLRIQTASTWLSSGSDPEWSPGAMTEPADIAMHREIREGVPVRWAQGAGDLTGALMFRVGFADETLILRGITHLVEHLS